MRLKQLFEEAHPTLPAGCLYHGTTEKAVDAIQNDGEIIRGNPASDVSLGGAYLTNLYWIASMASSSAARLHGSQPVILIVKPTADLYPDEDWVAEVASKPPVPKRYQRLVDELKRLSGGRHITDAYLEQYDDLNRKYHITWRDSLSTIGCVRQAEPLSVDQIVSVWRR